MNAHAHSATASRRRFLKLAGGTVVLIPLVNLYGCSEQETEQPARQPEPQPAEPTPAPEAQTAPGDQPAAGQGAQATQPQGQSGSLTRLEESNPQAQALGYKHSAEDVDQSAYPNYQPGQLCSNCTLFQAELGEDPWGGCQIFPGNLVNANGWCSAYVPVS
jgi:hypothetical protein